MIVKKEIFNCLDILSSATKVVNDMINEATPEVDNLFGEISQHITTIIRKVKDFTREIFIIERYITCEKAKELYASVEEIPEEIKHQVIQYRNEDDICLFTLDPCVCDKDPKKLLDKINIFLEEISKRRAKSSELSKNILSSLNNIQGKFANFSQNITKIIEIAEKVDLIAINAYVEAARMGQHGKGFEIIAENIRKAAIDIQNLGRDINLQFGELEDAFNENNEIFKHYQDYEEQSKKEDDKATVLIKDDIMGLVNNFVKFISFTSDFSKDIFEEIQNIQKDITVKLQYVDIDNQRIQNIGKKLTVITEMLKVLINYFSDKFSEEELMNKFNELENKFKRIATVFREVEITAESMDYDLSEHTETVGEKFEEAEGEVELF